MMRSTGLRPVLVGVVVVVVALAAAGCDWIQFGFDAGSTHHTADSGLSTANVPTLVSAFTAATGGAVYSSPAVAADVAYLTSDDGRLYAFSASGTAGCTGTPVTCAPLWTASIEPAGSIGSTVGVSSSPAVVGGVVYVGSTDGKLYAFDATGTTNCTGTPTTCTPLWTATTGGAIFSSPKVVGNVVYVGSTDGKLYALDATGTTNCTGTPTTCTPLWTATTSGAIDDSPAVAGGVVYVGSTDGKLYALDATGTTNCTGTPTTCTPLWTATTSGAITFSSPAVAGGVVYVGSTDGKLYALDATGTTNCTGTPTTCTPLWTATTSGAILGSPAVAAGVVYIGSTDHDVYALDAAGTTNCTGTPTTCTPLWTATTGGAIRSTPVVSDGLLFVGSDDHRLMAFDATGSTGCSGTPSICTPSWSAVTGAEVASSPVIAQRIVYAASLDHQLHAYQPWVFTRPTCAANPHTGLSPCQIQDAYRLPSQVAGTGRTVAIVDAYDNPNAESDLAVYRAAYGLPPCTTANGCFTKLNQSGSAGSYPAPNHGWGQEISLDLDAVSATCPQCHITLVEANSNSFGNLAAAEQTAAALNPTAISNSWGGSEFSGEGALDGYFSHAGLMTTFSTGDSGYGTSYPSSIPTVTAVGGTTLATDGSARGWSEAAWSGAQSGCSSQEPKPAWQSDPSCAARTTADVAALAGTPGLAIYDTYGDPGWETFGGTSLASPIIASVYAMAYPDTPIASTYADHSSLFDVTSGSNGSCGGSYLCTAGTGYDGPTGLGTPCGTAAFGTGPFATASCPLVSSALAAPNASAPVSPVVLTPACDKAAAGFARCHADKITPTR